jgi:carbamoylphosphate synthase large subunit
MVSITKSSVTQVIQNERPGVIFVSCGGQTALNCGVELHKSGFLQKHSCKALLSINKDDRTTRKTSSM